jgi:hypothetical protein
LGAAHPIPRSQYEGTTGKRINARGGAARVVAWNMLYPFTMNTTAKYSQVIWAAGLSSLLGACSHTADGSSDESDIASARTVTIGTSRESIKFVVPETGLLKVKLRALPLNAPNPEKLDRKPNISLTIEGLAEAQPRGLARQAKPVLDPTKMCKIYEDGQAQGAYLSGPSRAEIERCWIGSSDTLPWDTTFETEIEAEMFVGAGETATFVVEQTGLALSAGATLTYSYVPNGSLPLGSRLIVPHTLSEGEHLDGFLSEALFPNAVFPFHVNQPAFYTTNDAFYYSRNGCEVVKAAGNTGPEISMWLSSKNATEEKKVSLLPAAGDYALRCGNYRVNQGLALMNVMPGAVACTADRKCPASLTCKTDEFRDDTCE